MVPHAVGLMLNSWLKLTVVWMCGFSRRFGWEDNSKLAFMPTAAIFFGVDCNTEIWLGNGLVISE